MIRLVQDQSTTSLFDARQPCVLKVKTKETDLQDRWSENERIEARYCLVFHGSLIKPPRIRLYPDILLISHYASRRSRNGDANSTLLQSVFTGRAFSPLHPPFSRSVSTQFPAIVRNIMNAEYIWSNGQDSGSNGRYIYRIKLTEGSPYRRIMNDWYFVSISRFHGRSFPFN